MAPAKKKQHQQQQHVAAAAKERPAVMLKTKGGKPFSGLANLTDEASLQLTWKLSNRVAAHLEHGQRLENMSWRLWHMRDVIVGEGGEQAEGSQRTFNALSASVAHRLESDRKRSLAQLSAPTFKWTDANDAVRHRAIVRTQKRDDRGRALVVKNDPDAGGAASSKQLTKEKIRAIIGPTNRKRTNEHALEDAHRATSSHSPSSSSSSSTSSSSSSSSSLRRAKASKASIAATSNAPPTRRTSSPPVCWRLTHEQVARQRKVGRKSSEEAGSIDGGIEERSTWTLQEIEDAERELQEQGVELNGAFIAMLTDLKTGDLAKVKRDDDGGGGARTGGPPSTNEHAAAAAAAATTPPPDDSKRPRPQCVNCGATSTPLWRRDANFELQCNACGLYEKLHKRSRPKALKQRRTDRKQRNADGPDQQSAGAASANLSPNSESSTGAAKDEWVGIHAGSRCANCGTGTTPLWRKDREGRIICNACGLYYKLHNAHRPVTMRMDAIKRRSRYDDRRRMGSFSGSSAIGQEDATNNMAMLMRQASTVPHTPTTPSASSIMPPFFQDTMPLQHAHAGAYNAQSPLTMPTDGLHPLQNAHAGPSSHAMLSHSSQQQHHPLDHQHHHAAALQGGHSHVVHTTVDGIHIPSSLWEHQVCPMGAWGENCCQNLPQPSMDIQEAILAADEAATPVDQAAVTAAMDALLNNGDWMADFASPSQQQVAQSSGMQPGASPAPMQFDPSAVAMPNGSVVGPTYPLKRRKIVGNGEASGVKDASTASPTNTGSAAGTPASWWGFPNATTTPK